MTFIWPSMLWALLGIPFMAAAYILLYRRRRRALAASRGLGLLGAANAEQAGVRRHIPAVLFLASLAAMFVALARPQSAVSLPSVEGTVILVFDVSGSMSAQDIQPNRLEAAKAAARDFVQHQPATVQVGVVAFSDGGLSVLPPASDKASILAAINRLSPQRGSSVGGGIETALKVLAETTGKETSVSALSGALPGASGVIVLLTDGENNMTPDPMQAASMAAEAGVRIDTIGIGSPQGTTLEINGMLVHTQLDEESLKQISLVSRGTYFNAQSQDDLTRIYNGIQPKLVVRSQQIEITSLFAALGMLVLLMGGAFSLLWFGRVP